MSLNCKLVPVQYREYIWNMSSPSSPGTLLSTVHSVLIYRLLVLLGAKYEKSLISVQVIVYAISKVSLEDIISIVVFRITYNVLG